MSDESSTSISGGQDPVYTTSLTSTIGRPPRRTYFVIQFIAGVSTLGACWISRHFTSRVGEADIKDYTTLTALMMRVGELLTTPVGLACGIFLILGLGLLAIRGAIDGILKFLIWANVIWLICFLAYHTMAIWLPLLRAKQAAGH
jgi:hypothetical protein